MGYVKLNYDGSVKLEDGMAGVGSIMRNENCKKLSLIATHCFM
jgi:hypothetical protein